MQKPTLDIFLKLIDVSHFIFLVSWLKFKEKSTKNLFLKGVFSFIVDKKFGTSSYFLDFLVDLKDNFQKKHWEATGNKASTRK